MKQQFFTVGPTQLYPSVSKHILNALEIRVGEVSHRGKTAEGIVKDTSDTLRNLMQIPKTHHIFYVGSSLESMERTLQNIVEKYCYHLVFGEFSKKFATTAKELGKQVVTQEISVGQKITSKAIKVPRKVEVICITHNETSTGVQIAPKTIHDLSEKYPDKLIALDVVSSVPYVPINYAKIDVAFFSVQKGFGLPAGLSVMIVSPRAVKKAHMLLDKKKYTGSYHSFVSLAEKESIHQTPETPNLLYISVLGKVSKELELAGRKKMREETEKKAGMVYAFFEDHPHFAPFVHDSTARSMTTLVIDVKGKTKELQKFLREKGIIVSSGYGKYKDTHIRIANFPSQSPSMMKKLLQNIAKFI